MENWEKVSRDINQTATRYWNNRVSPHSLRHDLEMDSPTLWFSQDEF